MIRMLLALALTRLGLAPGLYSRAVAARRFALAGGAQLVTRAVDTAPDVDMNLDLAQATGDQLREQRTALITRLGNPQAGDDTAVLAERAQAVAAAITAYNARAAAADEARSALLGGDVAQRTPIAAPGAPAGPGGAPAAAEVITLGRAFAGDERVRSYTGHGRVHVTVPGEVRALFDSTQYPSQPTRVPGIQQPNRDQPLTLLDLVDRQSISTNTVEWVQETGYPQGAAEVAEGGVKPESTFSVELKSDTAATIAHWVNITRQAVADESQLRGYVEGRLVFGLMKRLNGQLLNGNGTAPNLRGILATSGIGTYTAAAGEAAVISIRKAKTVAQLSEYDPDAVVMNPVDWERVELSTDSNGQFRVTPSVMQAMTPRLWGLNVVVTTNVQGTVGGGAPAGGTFVVGGFREGATLWEREGVELFITDSHASNFTSNILTLLVEMRAVLSVWRPKAFVRGTFSEADAA